MPVPHVVCRGTLSISDGGYSRHCSALGNWHRWTTGAAMVYLTSPMSILGAPQ